jgi:hypothetical protein
MKRLKKYFDSHFVSNMRIRHITHTISQREDQNVLNIFLRFSLGRLGSPSSCLVVGKT